MNKLLFFICLLFLSSSTLFAQPDRWQQAAKYEMEIDFDVKKHQFKGKQTIDYTNNSPDYLKKVFYHLYFNAFQPGSMMDIRSQTLPDPDRRVKGRIATLKDNEIGYQKINSLKVNGKDVKFEVNGTILEVTLNKPIGPGKTVKFEMDFDAQVPVQIRRSGRNNAEGIDYSMSQWYPKMCEYDYQGWHANPYVGREFYGIWGDFDVKITIDKNYTIGGTGYLQNANEIGKGYEKKGSKIKAASGDKLTWHFFAPNVHDFAWGADPDYKHISMKADCGVMIHCLYQSNENTEEYWSRLPEVMNEAFNFINEKYGKYPYDQYSFIQGGDGGMEYPMATLITGERAFSSLVGVSVHELVHSWYQMILGTNEALYAWMDEGFTSYASAHVMNHLRSKGLLPGEEPVDNPMARSYIGYANFNSGGSEEALSTHADHFMTNSAYGVGSYTKGSVFLQQLEYIVGKQAFDKGMLTYFDTWKFKHPNINDFIRVMEKESDLELDWYKEYWVNTIHTIDYGVQSFEKMKKKRTKVILEKVGVMPMPIDLVVTYKDGTKEIFNIPLRIMRGEKAQETKMKQTLAEDWPWTHPTYELIIPTKLKNIKSFEIDPSKRIADVNPDNNKLEPAD